MAKAVNCVTFYPDSGSAADTRATTAKEVLEPKAAAEPVSGTNVAQLRTFAKAFKICSKNQSMYVIIFFN